jgi:catechol 2,3-dioxygenase-like lactoylglutathione lyase family enzyme
MKLIANGRGGTCDAAGISRLIAGSMVSTDLAAARKFYEEFLGFECVRCAPDRLLVRDRVSAELARRGEPGGFVIEVRQVDHVEHPHTLLNHFGLAVDTVEEVDRIRAIATSEADRYGIKKIHPITKMHGSYQFYFIDRDDNWWEIECRLHGHTHEQIMGMGDYKREGQALAPGEVQ